MNCTLRLLPVAAIMLLAAASQALGQSFTLQSRCQPGSQSLIEADLEVGGDVKLTEQGKVKTLPMSVIGKLKYYEKVLSRDEKLPVLHRSIRHYDDSSAVIKIDKNTIKPALHADHRLIAAEVSECTVTTLFSPMGPLSREELELVNIVGNSLLVEELLPQTAVEVGKTWQHEDKLLAALLCLDAIKQSDVESSLTEVEGQTAKMAMNGTLQGAIGGVSTELQIKARYNFDMTAGRINWFAISIKENRSVGHVGPGLDVVAKLRMKIVPGQTTEKLSEREIAGLPLESAAAGSMLSYKPATGTYQFHHDRRWFFTREDASLSVLRLVDRGELLAQCNLSPLKDLKPGSKMQLEEFQADVQKSLGKNFGQFLQATESKNAAGQQVLRVVAAGVVAELPIQWNYYLVVSPEGKRLAFAFTLEQNLLERFADADQPLVDSVDFSSPVTQSTQSAAKPTGAAKR